METDTTFPETCTETDLFLNSPISPIRLFFKQMFHARAHTRMKNGAKLLKKTSKTKFFRMLYNIFRIFSPFLVPFPPYFLALPALYQATLPPSNTFSLHFFRPFFCLHTYISNAFSGHFSVFERTNTILYYVIYFISARKHFYRYLVRGAPYSPHNLSRLSFVNHVHPIIQSPYCLSVPPCTHPRLSSHCHAAATGAWPARTPTPVLPLSYGFRGPPTWHSTTACLPSCCLARDPF